jgi:hypothetical protein
MMAKRKVNKSAAIREAMQANPKATAKEIVEALRGKGIKVTVPLVYFIKSHSNSETESETSEGHGVRKRAWRHRRDHREFEATCHTVGRDGQSQEDRGRYGRVIQCTNSIIQLRLDKSLHRSFQASPGSIERMKRPCHFPPFLGRPRGWGLGGRSFEVGSL